MADTNFIPPHSSTDEGTGAPPRPLFLGNSLDFSDAINKARLPGHAVRAFATSVYRIAGGCQVVNDLLAQEYGDDPHRSPGDPHSPPVLLGPFHRGQLQLLVSASMASLSREADRLATWAYEFHTAEGLEEVQERTAALVAEREEKQRAPGDVPGA